MTAVQALREFINERLTAAAGEIFTAFEQTIVRYEEEIARERTCLDNWNPQIKLDRTDSPRHDVHNQETTSSLEPEEHEPPHIKKEEEDHDEELSGGTSQPMTEVSATTGTPEDDNCLHKVACAVVNSLNSCEECSRRPFSSPQWLGFTCQLCSKSWHKSCFFKRTSSLDVKPDCDPPKSSDDCCSDEDCVPCTSWSSNGSRFEELWFTSSGVPASSDDPSSSNTDPSVLHCEARTADLVSSKRRKKKVSQPIDCMEEEEEEEEDTSLSGKFDFEEDLVSDVESSNDDPNTSNTQSPPTTAAMSEFNGTAKIAPAPNESSYAKNNYCYVCKTPQSKIARHLKKHEKEEPAIAEAFSLPKYSKERKKLLEKLRNKGNFEHNQEVLTNNDGLLKVKRRSKQAESSSNSKMYVHCVYCKGMFIRNSLWRHSRSCPAKRVSQSQATGKVTCLPLADIAQTTCTQAVIPGVWKLLKSLKEDEIASVVQNDFLLLQLSQSLFNKHGSDPTKSEYMRQRIREMGRLLLTLRKKSVFSFEEATKPKNFQKVIAAVKTVAGYDEKKKCYRTQSLALNLGYSLKKIGDILLCRAIAAEDEGMIKLAEQFTQLCTKEWARLVPNKALASLTKSKLDKPSTLPFTEDVQRLHQYLEKKSADAVKSLKENESPRTYAELARLTLAQMILINRHSPGQISKITLESFKKRKRTELREDVAASLSQFEQKLAKYSSRVEIMDKKGTKAAVLVNPEVLSAATLLVEKRDACDVRKDNPFLFGRPKCPSTSHYSGQDCIRKFAVECGSKNPEHLVCTQLHKHVATLCQILSLKDNELDQLANFLGHDIPIRRDFLRLPEATVEMARISKLLLAMENGSLAEFQGKSFDEIQVEDLLDPELDGGEQRGGNDRNDGGTDGDKSDRALGPRGKRKRMVSTQDETKGSKEKRKRIKSTQDEAKTSNVATTTLDTWETDIQIMDIWSLMEDQDLWTDP
ncbi:uncharacterized protein LOC115407893 isoform X2 [Salarias fasciatus]|uniref:uncharacterized protein LOC115407893 isoform X2 n=1 Tax=Salarias fasciatus TaxID=181472 RepID=UPI0011765A0B|nr:uncharacterized protein LOC115407893 isoform X2 [Salarias fasciatus]